jgi:aspartyl-tRNA(Asn)/glutamyl-tRNA(Gln) amidotransferase subunit A
MSQKFKTKITTIREIHDAFDRKEVSAMELTRDYLNAAKATQTGAFLTLSEDRALSQAKAADELIAREGRVPRDRKPLLGIPLAIKDNMSIDGVRTTCGSRLLENYIAPYTATAVARLEAAGSISLGKLNMDEFGMGGSNENSAYGPVQHPTHSDRVPGGSSGGSATAVRAELCAASLGSDTGGSIRLPSSYCGIVGMKPTYGRVSRSGLVAFASSLDQIGPMARSVEDAAALLDVMSGHDELDSTSAPESATQGLKALSTAPDWNKLRVGVPQEYLEGGGLNPDVAQAIQSSLQWFESQGAKLVPLSLPHTQYAVAVYYLVAVSEASSNLARFDGVRFGVRPPAAMEAGDLVNFYQKVRASFGPEVKRRIILGTFALSSGYADAYYKRACQVRRLIKQDFDQAFEKVDLIAGPVSTGTAFKLGEKSNDPMSMYLNDIFTVPANLAGIPALSVPCGEDKSGLPIGLHLMAKPFGDERLLAAAHAFEKGRGARS